MPFQNSEKYGWKKNGNERFINSIKKMSGFL